MKAKHLLPIIAFFTFPGILDAQITDSLDINNIKSSYIPDYMFKSDTGGYTGFGAYEVPKGSGVKSIYASAFWVSGLEVANNLRLSANDYYTSQMQVTYGPIANSYNAGFDSMYRRVYKVTRAEINNHIANYASSGYTIPSHIAHWPGNGNTANGEAAILAPFIDRNNNGIYEPNLGDYPDVPGDQAIFLIMNDQRGSSTYCQAMGLEFHVISYVFAAPLDSPLANTTFTNVKLYNRSNKSYHQVCFSNWVDNDLGCANNDRIGCDTSCNFFYVYNDPGLLDRGAVCPLGEIGYGRTKVAQGTVFLNKKMSSFAYFNIHGGASTGDPGTCVQYRNYQTGYWRDGTPYSYGSSGFLSSSTLVKYLFPGDPTDTAQWSELNPQTGPSIPAGDRRGVGTVLLDSLYAGGMAEVDIAYVTSFTDSTSPRLSEVVKLKNDACHIRYLFAQGGILSGIGSQILDKTSILIYPNPAKDLITIESTDILTHISVSDLQGRELISKDALNDTKLVLDLSHISKGIYLINATSRSGNCIKRIILD